MNRDFNLETAVVHAGNEEKPFDGALVIPVFQSSTYLYTGQSRYEDLKYIRLNNSPNHRALHKKLAVLEGAQAGLVTASGMAAISSTLLSLLSAGTHFLAQDCLYGGTRDLITNEFSELGIDVDFISLERPEEWSEKVKSNTRVVYVESISNPKVQVGNLLSIAKFAKERGLISVIDNTFATPVNFRPLEHGFDLVVHSCTKYLNGHTDIVAGAVVGSTEAVERINKYVLHLGACLDPHACFLLDRGLKTLALRVRQQNVTAKAIAGFLAAHPKVREVNYPSLNHVRPSDGTMEVFSGFGGMLSFDLESGVEGAQRFINELKIPVEAPSLGGVESLVTRPCTTSHSGWSKEERELVGITDSLIRCSMGIESTDDLLRDFELGLNAV